jgi:coproporphyrinogen III oxidase
MTTSADVLAVRDYFMALQDTICTALETVDGSATFSREEFPGPEGGLARPRVIANGAHIEKAAVQFTHSIGKSLPPAATERNPHLAGHGFQAVAISLIVHPENPYAPTTHMNLRFFMVDGDVVVDEDGDEGEADPGAWYFGGGFDLTPYYGFAEDCVHWHEVCRDASGAHYPAMKQACDEYFYLTHRSEPRGIGGIFFDDFSDGGFDESFALVRSIGDAFLPAYQPILERRVGTPWGETERDWQLYRRGRYAEFNLAIDRGTRYGIQSGRRIESVLASLPPLAAWRYAYEPEAGSAEAALLQDFLPAKDWLST